MAFARLFDRSPWQFRFAKKGRASMEDIAARRAAESLLADHKANLRFKPLGPPEAPATISDAYDIQEKYVTLLRSEHGDAVGYKVGLTSATMQAFCGIDHPIAGVVLARRVHRSEATARRSDFGRLGLEFEIAVRIKSDVPVTGAPCTAEMIAPHIDGVCAAIELVDDRSADYADLDVLSLVADNSWNGGIVLSEFATKWPDPESVLGACNERQCCNRRRARTRHPRASLQLGRVARHAIRFAGRRAESRPSRDDRKRHENRIPGGRRNLSF
jgi:2-keto-4-pentenoate hydratase